MNEAVAKLLDLLVHEVLWPMVEEKVKKNTGWIFWDGFLCSLTSVIA